MTGDQRDLDALLRGGVEPLSPPPGSWQSVRRRARRRRWAKVGVAVGSVVVVAAGAIPAVLAVRAHQDNQQVRIAAGPTRTPPAPNPSSLALPNPLAGFAPTSVSFVSQTEGYLFGTSDTSNAQLALTTDGGSTWSPVPAPPVDADEAGMRFAGSTVGFVFGKRYYVTFDGGQTWTRQPSPGRIVDLETMSGRVWALVRPHVAGDTVELYGASLDDPSLRPVKAVPALPDPATNGDGDAIAVIGTSVDVVAGARSFWSTRDGKHWHARTSPCAVGTDSARVAAWSDIGVVMACGTDAVTGSQTKQVFESADAGRSWSATAGQPSPAGRLATLGAGTSADVIVGTTGGGAQLTRDGGQSWQTPNTTGIPLGFVGFISSDHIVAIPDRGSTDITAFLGSVDAGRNWTVARFPN